MRCLYIDTTSNYLYTGIVEKESLLCERKIRFDKDLSTMALTTIVDMMNSINLSPRDVDKIILVNGPGSFTGCRIGITIAKTYSWALNIPISTITSLEAMALSNDDYDFHVPVLDARRDFVFAGIYDKENNQILKNQYIKKSVLETAINNMSDNFIFITNDLLELNGEVKQYNPDILSIVNKYKDKEEVNPHGIDAEYLKLTEAEEKLNDKNC
ncbi:MAG: tRNA (adenosine(37)-N6)-threonylcarbamoyltransferase complex dimerization subunit type 1 TsaB [Firmicutes bacterium]|nr:tRNA (adenosine(37)-N6)-threonylcarbamoyltransferase complex dimerization subunit type 1 TsaB [Bacillota bacterium]